MNLKATFIIPTYNAEKYIDKCLKSISIQNYHNYEVFILDGGSKDKTLEIVNSYVSILPLRIILNPKVDAESGKYIGIGYATGDIIILLDSDNEITDKYWLFKALSAFIDNPDIWGVESPWILNKADMLLNQYFTLLRIADPVARMFSATPKIVSKQKNYNILEVNLDSIPVTGANGFFWRKSLVCEDPDRINKFEEANYVAYLVGKGYTRYARLNNTGIYHYYTHSLSNYIKKRVKIANKYISRKESKQKTWVDKVGPTKFLFSVFYNASILGPTLEVFYQIYKSKNIAWLYHPLISLMTVFIYGFYYLKRKISK